MASSFPTAHGHSHIFARGGIWRWPLYFTQLLVPFPLIIVSPQSRVNSKKWKPYRLWSEYTALVTCSVTFIKRWNETKMKFSIYGWLTETEAHNAFWSYKLKRNTFERIWLIMVHSFLIGYMDGVLGKYPCRETNRNRIWLDKNKCSRKFQYCLFLPSGLFLHTFWGVCTPSGGSKCIKDAFVHFCGCLNAVFGSNEIIRMLLGVHFVHPYRIGCLGFFPSPNLVLVVRPWKKLWEEVVLEHLLLIWGLWLRMWPTSQTIVYILKFLSSFSVRKFWVFPDNWYVFMFCTWAVSVFPTALATRFLIGWSSTSLPFFKVLRQSCIIYFDSLQLIKLHFTLFLSIWLGQSH